VTPLALPILAAALALAAPTIVIDAGHGGHDPGAVGNGLYEKDLNLDACLAFRDWAELDTSDGRGGGSWDVRMTRESDVSISLSGRCDYANGLGADYFLSIHTNAGGGDGTETYAYASGTTAATLASNVQAEVLDHLGTRDRGVKYESFYVLVYTSMPADLNEMAFIDVWSNNAELLSDPANLDEVGLAHLHAIQRQTGLSAYTPSEETDPGEPTGRVWFDDYPSSLEPGEDFTVTVGYETDLHAFDQRGYLGLRMVDAGSWDTLDESSWDNGGTGIQGPSGDHAFSLRAPSDADAVIFVAWIAPLSGGWDERFDDSNSSANPTEISGGGDDPVDTGEPPDDGEIRLINVPGFVVAGQPFELRLQHGEGLWDDGGWLSVELIEQQRGLVVDVLSAQVEGSGAGVAAFDFTYDGQAETIWFHACASHSDGGGCIAEASSEDEPTRVMQGRERFVEGGCACSSSRRLTGAWIAALFALLGLGLRRRA
jgi:N-acetylmuramoyl-L-alanine amidase